MSEFTHMTVFRNGEGGYGVYRIPALLTLPDNRVLAFCEGRPTMSDAGRIDTVVRISDDGGRTFGDIRVAAHIDGFTAGNPCPVYDPARNRVLLVFTGNAAAAHEKDILRGRAPQRQVFLIYSDDGGETWSTPRDISAMATRPDWTWYATGPCHAVRMRSGRIVVPCNHGLLSMNDEPTVYVGHCIYSDDGGETWRISADIGPHTNENTAAEMRGSLYVNLRSYAGRHCRASAVSYDGGRTFSAPVLKPELVESVCQGSLLSVTRGGTERLLFCNPADAYSRRNLTLRESFDGNLWRTVCVITPGDAAYCDLCELPDGIGVLYETDGYTRLALAVIPY